MRRLKITAVVTLLSAGMLSVLLAGSMAWLVKSEQGSRWLLEQGLDMVPVAIEVKGISGTLADGLGVESLSIIFPTAEVKAKQVNLSWSPVSLMAGIVDINNVHIAELGIDVIEEGKSAEQSADAVADTDQADQLFWLQFPVHVSIHSGQIDKLRIEEAEFENLDIVGGIGQGKLEIESLYTQIAGIELQVSGELVGPGPGQLEAVASWQIPAQNLKGAGSFSGDIEKLAFTHVINVPEAVNFNGTISSLFDKPALTGAADWPSVRLPGETLLFSNAGNITVSSDFRSARLEGGNTILLEDWPQAPMQLQALVDLQGITIDSYSIDALDGQVTGQGRIEYGDKLNGKLKINATKINTAKIGTGLDREELPGHIDFDAILLIESAERFEINVSTVNAQISGNVITGLGRARWQGEKLAALDADLHAGSNQLTARLKLGKKLDGSIDVNAPELAMLWPGLQGKLNASVFIGGSPEQPQARTTVKATAVSFNAHSLETFSLNGQLQSNNQLAGELAATGLVSGKQQLGNLDMAMSGMLTDFQSSMKLAGGVVDVAFRTSGGWDGEQLTQRFEYGHIQPDGFERWQLEQQPELRLSATTGQLGAHCWKQHGSSICIDNSDWSPGSIQSKVTIDRFALNTLQPLLAEGYSLDGKIDAELKLVRDSKGLQGQLQWRQSRTVVAYSDEIDRFETVLDEVLVDILSDETQTNLSAKLTGEQGLNMTATAIVNGPLVDESPLKATVKGSLPSIELLRPLARRVVQLGKLQGELRLDLDAEGTLGDPQFTGGAYLNDGLVELSDAGVTLSEIKVSAQSSGGDKLRVTGELRSGEGRASILGEIRATEKPGLEADIHIQGQNLASLRIPELSLDTSPDLKLHIGKGVFDISGSIMIPHATAEIRALPKNAVPRSADVIVHTSEHELERQDEMIVTGDVEVLLGDDVRFRGFGLDSRLDGGLRLAQSRGGFLRSTGTVRVREGFLSGYGKELRVDRGELTFTGPLDDPLINIQVSRESIYESRNYIIGLRLTGSAQNVKTEPFSRPAMSEREVLAFLLLDRPPNNENETAAAALTLGLSQMMPGGDSGILGLDEVSFETNDADQAAMVAGKRVNDKLFVRYVFGVQGQPGAFRIRYSLGRGFSLESSTGARQALDLIYILER